MRIVPYLVLPFCSSALHLANDNRAGRRKFLENAAGFLILSESAPAYAFEGGVGGLGKTKPETGIVFREGSEPIQNGKGIVSAEIVSGKGNPILVEFKSPYPLLPTTSGLEARDLQQTESAFVQVIDGVSSKASAKTLNSVIIDNILGSQGKFGAYGTPTGIKIKPTAVKDIYKATFTTYTPGMRESDRGILLNLKWVDGGATLVALVTGTTLLRFKSQEKALMSVAESFVALDAPKTSLASASR